MYPSDKIKKRGEIGSLSHSRWRKTRMQFARYSQGWVTQTGKSVPFFLGERGEEWRGLYMNLLRKRRTMMIALTIIELWRKLDWWYVRNTFQDNMACKNNKTTNIIERLRHYMGTVQIIFHNHFFFFSLPLLLSSLPGNPDLDIKNKNGYKTDPFQKSIRFKK